LAFYFGSIDVERDLETVLVHGHLLIVWNYVITDLKSLGLENMTREPDEE
jgi:hypothetical protein